ncbi:hypothetical protein EJB05_00022, partial [Eragrostis curvula]
MYTDDSIFTSKNKYRFPATSSSWLSSIVMSLALGNVCLELPVIPDDDGGGFKMLKKLQLQLVGDLGDLTPFLSNCPALEWLSITRSFVPHLVVPRTYLHVGHCDIESIQLRAASITTFEYVGAPFLPIKINDSLKLSKANVTLSRVGDTLVVILRLTQIIEAAPQLEHFVLHMNSLD